MHFILETVTTPELSIAVGIGLALVLLALVPLLKLDAPTAPRTGQIGN